MAFSNLFRTFEGNSLAHRLDPRTKLILLLLISVLSVLIDRPLPLTLLFAAVLLLQLSAGVPLRQTRYLYYSFPMIFFAIALSQGFFYWGSQLTPLFTLISQKGALLGFHIPGISSLLAHFPGELIFYKEGFIYGSLQSLRAMTLLTAGLTLALTTHPIDILFGLRKFRLPYEVCFIISMSMRFLPQIMDEIRENFRAQQARGFVLKDCSFRDKMAASARILDTLFVRWIQGARDMALAIDLRGFRAAPQRTFVHERHFHFRDTAVIAASLVACLALWFWDGTGF